MIKTIKNFNTEVKMYKKGALALVIVIQCFICVALLVTTAVTTVNSMEASAMVNDIMEVNAKQAKEKEKVEMELNIYKKLYQDSRVEVIKLKEQIYSDVK